jgi:DNA-binding response OmpR family regulator
MNLINTVTDKTIHNHNSQHRTRTILVIDDDYSIRILLKNFLSQKHRVVCASNGAEAFEWLEENLPDLIICDIKMPKMNGYQFLEKLRQQGYTKHTPVIMLSCLDNSQERIKCYRLGSQDFLVKPFNPEELMELIRKNLNPIHYSFTW